MRERCQSTWQGPSDADCADDLLTVGCILGARHTPVPHRGQHPDSGESVEWYGVTGPLVDKWGQVVQAQFRPADV